MLQSDGIASLLTLNYNKNNKIAHIRWCEVLGFVPAGSVSSFSTLLIFREASLLYGLLCPPVYLSVASLHSGMSRAVRPQEFSKVAVDHRHIRLEESGVETGKAKRSSLKGRERAIVSQTNTGSPQPPPHNNNNNNNSYNALFSNQS